MRCKGCGSQGRVFLTVVCLSGLSLVADAAETMRPSPKVQHSLNGEVPWGTQWVDLDAVPALIAASPSRAQYTLVRERTPKTPEGHLQLARWCVGRGLKQEARAHYSAVLESDTDNAEARRQLGFFPTADGRGWTTAEALRGRQEDVRRQALALNKWGPKLQQLLQRADAKLPATKRTALAELRKIDDPSVVVPLEQIIVASHNVDAAATAVEVLAKLDTAESLQSLARIAAVHSSKQVAKAAEEVLRTRPLEKFVPSMLAALSTPLSMQTSVEYDGHGGYLISQLVEKETADRRQRLTRQTRIGTADDALDTAAVAEAELEEALLENNRIAEARNRSIEQLNGRVCAALASISEVKLPADPQQWWRWWNEKNDVYVETKELAESYEYEDIFVELPPEQGSSRDCLAAGTPVWTATGRIAIEKMQVGDLVLSQNPTTGELAYKPVLGVTVRPAAPLTQVRTDAETLRSSGGHPFWVDGYGWQKARNLKPGHELHGIACPALVTAATTVETEPTFNLIVADFHTYFVGNTRLLSHDNTICQPIDAKTIPRRE